MTEIDTPTETTPDETQRARGDGETSPHESVERPAQLLRLAHMIQATLNEVRQIDLDDAGRDRLADVYNRTVSELRETVSEDLRDELDDVAIEPLPAEPTTGELHIAQAQLVGWLQGLFQGIQASMATQQMAAKRQLAQQQQQGGGPQGAPSGQYL